MKACLEIISLTVKKILLTIILPRNILIMTSHMAISMAIKATATRRITTSKNPMTTPLNHHIPNKPTLETPEISKKIY